MHPSCYLDQFYARVSSQIDCYIFSNFGKWLLNRAIMKNQNSYNYDQMQYIKNKGEKLKIHYFLIILLHFTTVYICVCASS